VTATAPAEPVPASSVLAEAAPAGTAPPEPPEPPKPNPIVAWLTGGNTIARVGLLILFFGLAFLVKYAADNQLLPPELRVGAVAAAGIVLLGLGWRLRLKNAGYALGMQGAGVAVLYLTTFGALRLYGLVPPEAAFIMLAAISVFAAVLAISQDAVALAVIGAGGGFAAPILASTGGGSHVMLFGYYVLLNLAIVAIAWKKAWRALNVTGFAFTFVVMGFWGWHNYEPEHFATTEPFLVAFFLIYVLIAILVARETTTGKARYVDTTIVFGTPLAAFAMQAGVTADMEYGLAISALAAAALYLVLATWLLRTGRESWRLLAQSFLALGVVFATLAIPLALDARWTSATWAAEGAAVVWIGLQQRRTLARAFGILLQVLAGIAYAEGYRYHGAAGIPLVDAPFVGAVIIALAGLWTHRLLLTGGDAVKIYERKVIPVLFAWGLVWTLFAGLDEIDAHVPGRYSLSAAVAYVSVLAATLGALALRWQWRAAAWAARAVLPALWFFAIIIVIDDRHPLGRLGWIAWPLAFAALAWILRRVDSGIRSRYTTFLHAGSAVLLAMLGAVELNWVAAEYTAHHTAWSVGAVGFMPALVVLAISLRSMDSRWPITDHTAAYRLRAVLVLAAALAIWSLYANATHDGSSDPLPFLPIVNALDLAHVFAILSLAAAWMAAGRSGIEVPASLRGGAGVVLAGSLGFIWLTCVLLRTLSHWADIPYTQHAMWRSVLVQASLSIFWAALALTAMIFATRTARRGLWIVGAALMGVVVAKLFVIDLSKVGGIARIVSFIAVGVLMLVIGYFSPVPPRKKEAP